MFRHHCYLALRSRSKVRVKVKGRVKVMGQGPMLRSILWHAAVDIRGSALPSAVKSNKIHYRSKVFVCVSVISWRMRIIAADAVDRLLIWISILEHYMLFFKRTCPPRK